MTVNKKKANKFWGDIKLSFAWIALFSFLVGLWAIKTLREDNNLLRQDLEICKHNMEEVLKGVEGGRIIMELDVEGGK